MRIGAIVLAGGRSERLGQPKQLLPWDGMPLIEVVVREVCRAEGLDSVVVVLRREVAEQLGLREGNRLACARVVFPEETGEGCAASYRRGLAELADEQLDAVVVVLGDQPGMRAGTIERVVAEWERQRAPIVAVRYRDGEGHPLLFAASLFGELGALRGEKAAWKLVDRYRSEVRWVEVDEAMPRDIDTWEDYEVVRRGS
ncbi:Purine catabolism protein PucB [bacterium HR27]|nr:Purine catabolism protein PucB [bacterium HR27]